MPSRSESSCTYHQLKLPFMDGFMHVQRFTALNITFSIASSRNPTKGKQLGPLGPLWRMQSQSLSKRGHAKTCDRPRYAHRDRASLQSPPGFGDERVTAHSRLRSVSPLTCDQLQTRELSYTVLSSSCHCPIIKRSTTSLPPSSGISTWIFSSHNVQHRWKGNAFSFKSTEHSPGDQT